MTPKEQFAKTIRSLRAGRARERGVTLVEVLIVVAILALIAGGVAIYALPKFQEAQKKTASTDAKTLQTIVEQWKGDHPDRSSECPTLEQLKADKSLRSDQNTNDPWNHPYKIVCNGTEVSIGSMGPDGKDGTEDDIWAGAKPGK